MIRLAVENSPTDLAWRAFDEAALALHRRYAADARRSSAMSPPERTARMRAAQEVARLWDEWRVLFLAPANQGGAA